MSDDVRNSVNQWSSCRTLPVCYFRFISIWQVFSWQVWLLTVIYTMNWTFPAYMYVYLTRLYYNLCLCASKNQTQNPSLMHVNKFNTVIFTSTTSLSGRSWSDRKWPIMLNYRDNYSVWVTDILCKQVEIKKNSVICECPNTGVSADRRSYYYMHTYIQY